MGLDSVELIMRVEEEFAIEILDAEAELLTTPGMLCTLIEYKLSRVWPAPPTTHAHCPTSRAFYAVRRELMQLGIARSAITPQTPLEALLPRSQRYHHWSALGTALNFELPALERSPKWALVGLVPLGVFPIWLAVSPNTAIPSLALYALLWWLVSYLTQPLAVHAPAEMRSVADLSRRLSPRFCATDGSSTSDLWPTVRALIADERGIPLEQVTRDAHFIYDLGMD